MVRQALHSLSLLSTLSMTGASSLPLWLENQKQEKTQLRRVVSTRSIRNLQSLGEESCLEDAEDFEERLEDVGGQCMCRETRDGIVLICMDECAYCNEEQTICGIQSAQILYDDDTGEGIALGGVFHYAKGLRDTLAVENLECVEENGFITFCDECNVYVNGERCNSCELEDCGDGTFAENMDCENIEHGASFNFCEDVEIDDHSVFVALDSDQILEECLDTDILGSKKSKSSKSSKSSSSSRRGRGKGKGKGGYYRSSKSAKKAKSRRRLLV